MTSGGRVSARERESARANRPRGWAAMLCRAGAGALQLGRTGGRKGRRPEKKVFVFLFFKNVNSNSICLFH
jgi:hypothetical protein